MMCACVCMHVVGEWACFGIFPEELNIRFEDLLLMLAFYGHSRINKQHTWICASVACHFTWTISVCSSEVNWKEMDICCRCGSVAVIVVAMVVTSNGQSDSFISLNEFDIHIQNEFVIILLVCLFEICFLHSLSLFLFCPSCSFCMCTKRRLLTIAFGSGYLPQICQKTLQRKRLWTIQYHNCMIRINNKW